MTSQEEFDRRTAQTRATPEYQAAYAAAEAEFEAAEAAYTIREHTLRTPPDIEIDTDENGNPTPPHTLDMSRHREQTFTLRCPYGKPHLHIIDLSLNPGVWDTPELYEFARKDAHRHLHNQVAQCSDKTTD